MNSNRYVNKYILAEVKAFTLFCLGEIFGDFKIVYLKLISVDQGELQNFLIR